MIITNVTARKIAHPASKGRVFHTIVVEVTATGPEGAAQVGVGEVRASQRYYHESPSSAWTFLQECAPLLVGQVVDLNQKTLLTDITALVTRVARQALRAGDVPLGRTVHRPSRFALEVALLDLVARWRSVPLAAVLGQSGVQGNARVRRNIETVAAMQPVELYGMLRAARGPGRWLRIEAPRQPSKALPLIQAVHDAAELGACVEGVWFDLAGAWQPHEAAEFVDGYGRRFGASGEVPVILQDPLPSGVDELAWLVEKKTQLGLGAGDVLRILVGEPVWGLRSLRELTDLMPHVDLAICPQRAGGVSEILAMVERYRKHNTDGRILLHTYGRSTELTTLTLAHLATAVSGASYFAAKLRRPAAPSMLRPRPKVLSDGTFDFLTRPGLGGALMPQEPVSSAA